MVLSITFGHGFLTIPFWYENMFCARKTFDIYCVLSNIPECAQRSWTFSLFWEKNLIQKHWDALQSQPINCVPLSLSLRRWNKAFCCAVRVADVALFFCCFFLNNRNLIWHVLVCQHTSCMPGAHRGQITVLSYKPS